MPRYLLSPELREEIKSIFKEVYFELAVPQLEETTTTILENDEKLLTPKQSADFLSVSIATIYNWKNRGLIEYHRISRNLYFKVGDLRKAVKKEEGYSY